MERISAAEIDSHIIGYPCFKPILRLMKSPSGIPEFDKYLFTFAKLEGWNAEKVSEIMENLYDCLMDNSALFHIELCQWDGQKAEPSVLAEKLFDGAGIKSYSTCTSYYKKYQSNLNACLACIRSPYYANRFLKEELGILRFITRIGTEEEYTAFFKKMDDIGFQFISVYDALINVLHSTFTCYVPVNQIVYQIYYEYYLTILTLNTCGTKQQRNDFFYDAFFNLVSDHDKKKRYLPDNYLKNQDWLSRYMECTLERIEAAEEYSEEKVWGLIAQISVWEKEREKRINASQHAAPEECSTFLPNYNNRKKVERKKSVEAKNVNKNSASKSAGSNIQKEEPSAVKIAEPNQLSFMDLMQAASQYDTVSDALKKETVKTDENLSEEASICLFNTKDHLYCEDFEKYTYESPLSDSFGFPAGTFGTEENPISEQEVEVFSNQKQDESGIKPPTEQEREVHQVMEETCFENGLPYEERTNEICSDAFFLEFHPSKEELSFYRKIGGNLVELAEIEDAIISDKVICIEAVYDSPSFLLLFYVPRLHRYYQTDLSNGNELYSIRMLFRRNGIKKVCYQPYLLYSFCYKLGLRIRGVYSLMTHYKYLYPSTSSRGIRDMICALAISNREKIRETMLTTNTLLYHCLCNYKSLYRFMKAKEDGTSSLIVEQMELWDQALGYSYLLSGCMENEGRLFEKSNALRFDFHKSAYLNSKDKVLYPGYFAKYEFSKHTKHSADIIFHFLCNLSKEGYFGKNNIQIVYLAKNRIVFFIEESEFDYLDSVIGVKLRGWASQYGVNNLPLTVLYEYRKPPKKDSQKTT